MAAMTSLLEKPFKMSTFPINLARFHQHDVRAIAIAATAQDAESTTEKPAPAAAVKPPNASLRVREPSRLYWAAVQETGITSDLRPERIFVTRIPVSGPTQEYAEAACLNFRLNLTLNSSSSSTSQQEFCFFGNMAAAEASAPGTEFVSGIKSSKISQFTHLVRRYLGDCASGDELAEYINDISLLTEAELENLDSMRIWNIFALGGDNEKAFVETAVMEIPIRFYDLPPAQEQLLALPDRYEAPNFAVENSYSDSNSTPAACIHCNKNSADPIDKGKRKVAGMGDSYRYDNLEKKKARHGGAVRSEEPIEPVGEAESSASSN